MKPNQKSAMKKTTTELMLNAWNAGVIIPAFNIPHLPMAAPVVRALRDKSAFGLIQVARLEWVKFSAKSLAAVREEYEKVKDERYTRLHLDHVPVIDEDDQRVDFQSVIAEAIELGYESVMVDGSRLSLDENIACTAEVVSIAHEAGVPVEAELGAVLGHEAGPLPPYEELFSTGKGFTDPGDARRFVEETNADWLSVAIGNIHGAISGAAKSQKKLQARLNIEHLDCIRETANVPLVLHGGSGIRTSDLQTSYKHGISKINIGTTIRQAFESEMNVSIEAGQDAVYRVMLDLIVNELDIEGSANVVNPE
jgi:ketose-bisphosphate aldolase